MKKITLLLLGSFLYIGILILPIASAQETPDLKFVPVTSDKNQEEMKRRLINVRNGEEIFQRDLPTAEEVRSTTQLRPGIANAVRNLAGCSTNTLPANDDSSTTAITLPFAINFFGANYTQTYVNNNGNITFTGPLATFTPFGLTGTNTPIIAPFFADVDTRGAGSGLVQFGNTTVDGRQAFCVNYVNVGYYNQHTDKRNTFQLILINRADIGAGDFDIEFNYNQIQWEAGDASGGTGGLGGSSARAGYANGSMQIGTFLELNGSAVNGGLLDSNTTTGLTNTLLNSTERGRYIFSVRNGIVNPCPVQALAAITDPVAQQFENGNTLNTANLAPAMQTAYNNFRNAVAANGGSLTLNSAYRPPAYQLHLREVWDKWQLLKNNTLPQCQDLKTQVQAEVNRHGIGNLRTRPASATGYHTQGLAIDVNFTATGLPIQTIINLGAQNGLIRPLAAKDPVHFILGSQFGKLPNVDEDGEEFEQGLVNPQVGQTIPTANVFVTITKQIVNNNYVYFYRIRNNDSRPILAFEVGYNDFSNASQLLIPPVSWSFDTGLAAASTTSPTSWSSNLITTEESEFHSIEWRTENTNQNIQPLQTMGGFSVVLPQDDITYRNSSLKIVFADGSAASAQISAASPFDFDNDGKADVSVFRPSNGAWYLNQSSVGFTGTTFGFGTDKLVPADYDGDGKTDVAVYRGGTWYLQRSTAGFTGIAFGDGNDIPVPADYDGDGRADIAVFRPSNGTWYLQRSQLGFTGIAFGQNGDKPVAADYDGDGKTDIAVNRAGTWYINRSQLGFYGVAFGDSNDKLVPADYDGDGKADIAVFRPSNGVWYLQQSTAGFTGIAFGLGTDIPAAADYDGDGKADVAVVRNGNWYLNRTTQGFTGVQFGASTDLPVPNAFVR